MRSDFYYKNRSKRYKACSDVAEKVGFEPTCREPGKRISSFMKCVSGSVSFVFVSVSLVLGTNPHKHCIFRTKTPKKPVIPGKFESTEKCAKNRIFGKNYGKNSKNSDRNV